MKLGIIGAMEKEVALLKDHMENVHTRIHAGMEFWEGRLEGCPVVVVRCGVGKVNAAACTQVLADLFQVDGIVNTGIAGALDPRLDIGDFVISTDAMYSDFTVAALGLTPGQVPHMDVLAFPVDERLAACAEDACNALNLRWIRGRIATGDQFVSDHTQKERIISVTGGACTEMEGAAIAHTCYLNGIPCVILRAISDKADDSADMDYPAFEVQAANASANMTRFMAQRCAALPGKFSKM